MAGNERAGNVSGTHPVYPELPSSVQEIEEQLLERWRSEDLFRETLEATSEGDPFVFYEGPPTANGRPGLHHLISRTIKDLVCRHRTMQGRQVTRIAGWDTHGLPVEIEAERKLGISGKPEIEALGIEAFNRTCRESVFTYKEEWERLSERIGYWLDYSRPYVTFHTPYIESVWAILGMLAERGLLYRGHKSVPYCPRCGTALSSHEVAQGYAEVEDPSLYFLCDWVDEAGRPDPEGRSFLVWTTTPWTVPSNAALAVGEAMTYAQVPWVDPAGRKRELIVASSRVEALFGEDAPVTAHYTGRELLGQRYARPLDLVALTEDEAGSGWRVVPEAFVSADDGTGIVHMAPAFGADDYASGQRHGFPMLRPVDDRGCFVAELPLVGGMFVKDADSVLVEALRDRGGLFKMGMEPHTYPHCWRCRSPLIYMARESWFAATSTLKDRMLENNQSVTWHPSEVGEGRFGEWLSNNVDWALSRDRFWGTPLPAWVNDADPDEVEWISSLAELAEKVGGLPDDFDPHRPFIDALTWPAPSGTGTMRRVPQVLDVWFDSGAMPYAQWHWPHENDEAFEAHFPADFICEGLDQTRGWFYSLMAISTMLDRGPAYRNVIVNGLILDADGQKMSKSRGNTVDPWDAMAEFGADPLRWYLITVSNPWLPKRYDPEGVRELTRKFFDTLFNTYRFFAMYARVEGWSPGAEDPSPQERPLLDRWLLSRLHGVVEQISSDLDGYQLTRAYRLLGDFLNEDLSNWYVRRARSRFWGTEGGLQSDGRAAFRTLHEALVTVAQLAAPVVPFTADWLHRALLDGDSVHRAAFPQPDGRLRDLELEEEMAGVRAMVSLGRAAREEVRIRVRQPLSILHAVLPGRRPRPEVLAVLKGELNVREVRFLDSAEGLVTLSARPDFRKLGPRFQGQSQQAAEALRGLSTPALRALRAGEQVEIDVGGTAVPVDLDWIEITESAEGDLVVRAEDGVLVALDPTLTPELLREGMARELVNRIQRLRKEAGLEITHRIHLFIHGDAAVEEAARAHETFIASETLALSLTVGTRGGEHSLTDTADGATLHLGLSVATEGS